MTKNELIQALQKIKGNPNVEIIIELTEDTIDVYSIKSVAYNKDEECVEITGDLDTVDSPVYRVIYEDG